MAASFNKVLLMGNLTRDPELRYIPSGQPVTSFSIAVNRNFTGQTGEKKEEVSFVRIVVWGKLAEICNEYLKKGRPVFVEGRLQSRSWDAQDGSKRSTTEVVAQSVQFLGTAGGAKSRGDSSTDSFPDESSAPFDEPSSGSSISIAKDELRPDEDVPF
jgi:single-strand DNA-binding protein